MAKEHVVDQKGKTFIPGSLEVKVGDTLVFKNSDSFAHNAFYDDGANAFDIEMQKPGQDIRVQMKEKGTVEVECAIHPNMLLTVEVK